MAVYPDHSGMPFNDTALVFKVMNKMFAVLDLSENSRGITLKCDPPKAGHRTEGTAP